MKLINLPNKILRRQAKPIDFPLSKDVEKTINEMIRYIDDSQKKDSNERSGVGLAAPQVGHSLQMFYINIPKSEEENGFKEFLINPEIIGISERSAALSTGEGCLSVPFEDKNTEGLVHRFHKIIIKGYSFLQKKEITINKTGYHAIVLQHEYDHLQGKLFLDRINRKNPWDKKEGEVLI